MSPAAATSPVARAPVPVVTVSLVYSTPWLWLPTHMESGRAAPYGDVRIERIEFVPSDRPTLYVPPERSWMMWPLLLVKSEQVGCAIFRPGYELAFQGAGANAAPAGITWDPAPFTGRAIITARTLVSRGFEPRSEAGPPATATTTRTANPAVSGDAYAHLIADGPFWRALRERYDAGTDREAINVICEATARAAERRRVDDPAETRSPDESRTVDWCRSVASPETPTQGGPAKTR